MCLVMLMNSWENSSKRCFAQLRSHQVAVHVLVCVTFNRILLLSYLPNTYSCICMYAVPLLTCALHLDEQLAWTGGTRSSNDWWTNKQKTNTKLNRTCRRKSEVCMNRKILYTIINCFQIYESNIWISL